MFYRQVSSEAELETLPADAVILFDGIAASKQRTGDWLIAGDSSVLDSLTLSNMARTFHVVSEFSYYPEHGYHAGQVNLSQILNFVKKYDELPWFVVFEWTRDFFNVTPDAAKEAVWRLMQSGKVEPTDRETLRIV